MGMRKEVGARLVTENLVFGIIIDLRRRDLCSRLPHGSVDSASITVETGQNGNMAELRRGRMETWQN